MKPFLSTKRIFLTLVVSMAPLGPVSAAEPTKSLPLPGEVFRVAGHTAFIIPAKSDQPAKSRPWVWYAPTLPNLPGKAAPVAAELKRRQEQGAFGKAAPEISRRASAPARA